VLCFYVFEGEDCFSCCFVRSLPSVSWIEF